MKENKLISFDDQVSYPRYGLKIYLRAFSSTTAPRAKYNLEITNGLCM